MVSPGEIAVWRIDLDGVVEDLLPPPEPAETERAAHFVTAELSRRYLRSHAALRAILRREIGEPGPRIAATESGKPWLPDTPRWRFNLSHSRGTALVAVALDVDVGVDVEWIRPHGQREAVVERFFPPSEAAAFFAQPESAREREFFRRWTRLEAMWKALGVGLRGAGSEVEGVWTVADLDLGEGIAAAVAAPAEGLRVTMRRFGESG